MDEEISVTSTPAADQQNSTSTPKPHVGELSSHSVSTPGDARTHVNLMNTPQSIAGTTGSDATGTPGDHNEAPTPPHGAATSHPDTALGACSSSTAISAAAAAAAEVAAAEKKQRACDPCRGLKVKCEWPSDDVGVGSAFGNPCRRCSKSGRQCIVSVRARTNERHKRTDTRVSELEKRIDELTASLSAKGTTPSNSKVAATAAAIAGYKATMDKSERERRSTAWSGSPVMMVETAQAQAKVEAPPLHDDERPHKRRRETPMDTSAETAGLGLEDDRRHQRPRGPPPGRAYHEYIERDCIHRGIISEDDSERFFQRYREGMVMHMPAVIFPPSTRTSDLRFTTPVLFLAIMAAASSENQAVQRKLVGDVMYVLSELTIIDGKKSLELVQALHVSVIWYWPPEHFEELKFYQLVNLSVSIAIDIGLGVRPKGAAKRPSAYYGWREQRHQPPAMPPLPSGSGASAQAQAQAQAQAPPNATPGAVGFMGGGKRNVENAESLVARRSWLTCYYLASNAAMSLRRPNLVRWSPFMADCVRVLESSPEAAPTDRILCTLVRMNQLSEDIGYQFSPDEGFLRTGLGDLRTQVTLRGFQAALETLRRETPQENMLPAVTIGFEMTSMYLHEVILQSDELEDEDRDRFLPPHGPDSSLPQQPLIQGVTRFLTSSHISCIGSLLGAVTSLFDAFLAMELSSVRCLPVFNFVRVAYAVVILVKIHFSASVPGSEVARVIPKESVKLEYYIDRLLEKFKATVKGNRSRPAAKFLVVLIMLKRWAASEEDFTIAAQQAAQQAAQSETQNAEYRDDIGNQDGKKKEDVGRNEHGYTELCNQPRQQTTLPQHPPQQAPQNPCTQINTNFRQQSIDFQQNHMGRNALQVLSAVATESHAHAQASTPSTGSYDSTSWQPRGGPPSQPPPQPCQQQNQYMFSTSMGSQFNTIPGHHHHLPTTTSSTADPSTVSPSTASLARIPTPMFVPSGMPPTGGPAMFPPPAGQAGANGGGGWGGGVDLVMPDGGGEYGMNPNIDFEGLMTNFGMGLPAEYLDAYKPFLGDGGMMDLDEGGVYPGGM